jgi:hypothetical protein
LTGNTWDTWLQPGERILWQGAPKVPQVLRLTTILKRVAGGLMLLAGLAMAVLGLVAVVFAETAAAAVGVLFLACIGLLFVVLGGALMLDRDPNPRAAMQNCRYALTQDCAYVWQEFPRPGLGRYPIHPGAASGIFPGRGVDTVWFDSRHALMSSEEDIALRVEFADIPDGRDVLRLIHQIQKGEVR